MSNFWRHAYVKFLKDMVTKKRTIEQYEIVTTTNECLSVKSSLPPKRKDPCSFTIPCLIGYNYVGKTLCDLESSVNLMPKSVFMKLATGWILIDSENGEFTLRVDDQKVTINVLNTLKYADDSEGC
ncbi:uncharacterized protein LOC120158974 [Hibiscus syriacus]|uniref:uncharacterized protein LOC120158974 n=1 Tax=Hibiscus syriacus TaxID=106335 RepID=UPI001922E02B|nr:uncharacterized protein LOC120158974 [Hibiscus syriacus]